MTKSDLINALAEKEKLTEKASMDCVNLVFKCFVDALKRRDGIEIRGFGSFTVRNYEAYTGRNPKTGEQKEVKAKKLPFFKVGKELKAKVNSSNNP